MLQKLFPSRPVLTDGLGVSPCEVCATEVRAFGLLYGIWSETDVALADALEQIGTRALDVCSGTNFPSTEPIVPIASSLFFGDGVIPDEGRLVAPPPDECATALDTMSIEPGPAASFACSAPSLPSAGAILRTCRRLTGFRPSFMEFPSQFRRRS